MKKSLNRRKFLQTTALAGAGLVIPSTDISAAVQPTPNRMKSTDANTRFLKRSIDSTSG